MPTYPYNARQEVYTLENNPARAERLFILEENLVEPRTIRQRNTNGINFN
jgi:hypothetical protein